MPVPIELSDDFTGVDGAAWSGIWTTRNVIGTSPTPVIHANAGRMATLSPPAANDDRIIAYLAGTFTNFDVTFKYTNVVELLGQSEFGYRVGSGIASGTPTNGYALVIQANGNVSIQKINSYDFVTFTHDSIVDDHNSYWFRVRVKGSRHLVKWWADGGSEPPGWMFDITDATYTTGQIFLGTYNYFSVPGGVSTWAAVTIDWDDFHLFEVLPPDPGFRVESDPVTAIKIGTTGVVAAYMGSVGVPVTWP